MMAMFMANRIMDGTMNYETIFKFAMYRKYQDDVDAILIAEGKENLIVK